MFFEVDLRSSASGNFVKIMRFSGKTSDGRVLWRFPIKANSGELVHQLQTEVELHSSFGQNFGEIVFDQS
jgi:hypothetical protein